MVYKMCELFWFPFFIVFFQNCTHSLNTGNLRDHTTHQLFFKEANRLEELLETPLPEWINEQEHFISQEYDLKSGLFKLSVGQKQQIPLKSNLNNFFQKDVDKNIASRKLLTQEQIRCDDDVDVPKMEDEYVYETIRMSELIRTSSIESVIGSQDDRERVKTPEDYPFSAIVKIQYVCSLEGQQISRCSGAMIDHETVLTAAHCVMPNLNGRWVQCTDFVIYPGSQDGSQPFGSANATKVITSPKWDRSNQNFIDSDYAILKLDKPIGAKSGWFSLASECKQTRYTYSGQVNVTGYPDYFGGNTMVTSQCNVTLQNMCITDTLFGHQCDTSDGQSGSPLYAPMPSILSQPTQYRILGVHVQGVGLGLGVDENKAVYMGYDAIQWIVSNQGT